MAKIDAQRKASSDQRSKMASARKADEEKGR